MAGKVKKAVLYIVLSLMAVTCMVPFLLMLVYATSSGR